MFVTDTAKTRDKYKDIMIVMAVSAVIIAYMSAVFGRNVNTGYYNGFWALILPVAGGLWAFRNYAFLDRIQGIRETWGRPLKRKRDFTGISRFHKATMESDGSPDTVPMDDRTWNDMGMDQIFTHLDRTLTTPGAQVLYGILRRPSLDIGVLKERDSVMEYFASDTRMREKLQINLSRLGQEDKGDSIGLLWGFQPTGSKLQVLYTFLAGLAFLALVSIPFSRSLGAVLVLGVYAVNMALHYQLGPGIAANVSSIRYICSMISTASKISRMDLGPALEPRLSELGRLAETAQPLSRKGGGMAAQAMGDLGIILEYIRIYFLIDVRKYNASIKELKRLIPELRAILTLIGELDALLSMTSYRKGSEGEWVKPDLRSNTGGDLVLAGCDMKHPLIEGCVSNSINLSKPGILITGSNMSGKSTFLRVLGLNAIMAQTIYTCPAGEYRGTPFRVITSLTRSDDLNSGKSYYLTEAEALLNMVRAAEGAVPCLLLIDEILNGTNSAERISASKEIMRYLEAKNAITVVSTHDLRLTELVGSVYSQFHFSEAMNEEGLVFDYTLKEGVSTSRNAIRLMDYLGYPKEITDRAEASVDDLLERR